jgi:2-desacetyl-2-hydroxyethyl bacteriochlorophyllide A dehydrogenase
MRAAVVAEGGALDVATVPDPVPSPGELIVRVAACGLCGSDLKARAAMPVGTIMGHEFGGEVVALGPGTEAWRVGMRAAVLPVASCGTCAWCQAGHVAHCPSAVLMGLGGRAGGFAEFSAVPAASSFLLPPSLDPLQSALAEPYAVGLHTVDAAGIGDGDEVLIVGAGTVGLTCASWARVRGAGRVTVVDPNAERRAKASELGADDVMVSAGDATTGRYDVAIECVGKPGLLNECVAAARPRGRIVVAGVCGEQDRFWSVAALMKEVTIAFAVYYSPADFRTVIDAFEGGTIDPAPLVGRVTGMVSIDEEFELLASGSVSGKILIDPASSTGG